MKAYACVDAAGTSHFLEQEDVIRITKCRRFTAQRRALDALGIKYTPARNGEPLVRPEALDPETKKKKKQLEPRWDRI